MRRHKYFHFTVRVHKRWYTLMHKKHHYYMKRLHHHKFHRISRRKYRGYAKKSIRESTDHYVDKHGRGVGFWYAPAAKKVLGAKTAALPKANLSGIRAKGNEHEAQFD